MALSLSPFFSLFFSHHCVPPPNTYTHSLPIPHHYILSQTSSFFGFFFFFSGNASPFFSRIKNQHICDHPRFQLRHPLPAPVSPTLLPIQHLNIYHDAHPLEKIIPYLRWFSGYTGEGTDYQSGRM